MRRRFAALLAALVAPAVSAAPAAAAEAPEPRETMADVLARLGKPDAIVHAELDSRMTVSGWSTASGPARASSSRPPGRCWYITTDGTVFAITGGKSQFYATWFREVVSDRESVADLVNRLGQPDRIQAIEDHFAGEGFRFRHTIALTYAQRSQRWFVDETGYVIGCAPGPCQ
jgi:hypothetical protein